MNRQSLSGKPRSWRLERLVTDSHSQPFDDLSGTHLRSVQVGGNGSSLLAALTGPEAIFMGQQRYRLADHNDPGQ